jgi:hypothetical protein
MMPEPFLFVSHVSEDRSTAVKIVEELERRGVRCWIAPRDVHAGRPFDNEISDAIDASRAMLLIFSERCNVSEYIRREVTVAGESQKLIIPFRIEDAQPKSGLRVRLSDLHWIDWFASQERAIEQVITTFNAPMDGVVLNQTLREHTSVIEMSGAERRQITVLLSDLVDSMALSTHMDPEDLRDVILAYQKCISETVRRFNGFVAKNVGDGALVYFGYPQAHEDDAERAVRTGLELVAAVTAMKSPVPVQTRVGIATGLVVVGDLIGSGDAQELGSSVRYRTSRRGYEASLSQTA